MRYTAAISYLYGLAPRGMELGLARVEQALALRGSPERACPAVLVAGTNGKGSVATMIASVLRAAGYRVGLFTSPHLHRLVERFRIGGRPIAEAKLARKVSELRPFLDAPDTPPLTFFEVATLIAFELFRDARCEVMVLEVGLGGRLDATNVVTPLVGVITSIARDHMDRLGATLPAIAREKAGIARRGVPLVSGVREPSARRAVRDEARRTGAVLLSIDREFEARAGQGGRSDVRVAGRWFRGLRPALAGAYQADNLACAVAALSALEPRFEVDERSIRRGLAGVRWPGRLELIAGSPSVLCDAAHNPQAARALAAHLAEHAAVYPRRVLVFGVMRDKEHAEMLSVLLPEVTDVVFTEVETPRVLPAVELARAHGGSAVSDPRRALALARKRAGKRGLVVACGSIYVMAAVRAAVLGLRSDPPVTL